MKIIKKGQIPSEKKYRSTCLNCKTVFEFKEGETKYESDPREGGYRTIHCPLCAQLVFIYPKREV